VIAAANTPGAKTAAEQTCEANLYIGELDLQRAAKADATSLFEAATASCPPDYIESFTAKAELKALGVNP